LAAASVEELLQALLGGDASLQPLKRLLIERTEGNPFFLEESVRTLLETGVLGGEPGRYRLRESAEGAPGPATVQAVLAARIDRLPPENKRLLQCAAVVGKDVPLPILLAIAELREEWLRAGLADLQAGEFLYETSLFPDSEYTFKHALTHEVAYNSMLLERRRVVHARIVAAIEQLYPGGLPEQVERLAHHAVRGEVWDKAVDYSEQAGHRAAARWAHPEAVAYFDRALQAQKGLAASHQMHEQAIDLHLAAGTSLLALGEHDRIRDHLRDAEALAVAIDDRHRLAQVACELARWYWSAGEPLRAIDSAQRALALGDSLDDFGLAVRTNHYLGHANYSLGKYPQAIAFYRRNVENIT